MLTREAVLRAPAKVWRKQSRKKTLAVAMIIIIFCASLFVASVGNVNKADCMKKIGFGRRRRLNAQVVLVPGHDILADGFNVFDGGINLRPFGSRAIGAFTVLSNAAGRTLQLGSKLYRIPDQMMNANTHQVCLTSNTEKTLVVAHSTRSFDSKFSAYKGGYDETQTVKAGLNIGVASVGVEKTVRYALIGGANTSATSAVSVGKRTLTSEARFVVSSKLYWAQIDWGSPGVGGRPTYPFNFSGDFVASMNGIVGSSSQFEENKRVFGFFKKFGSHVIEKAELGAFCETKVDIESKDYRSAAKDAQDTTWFLDSQMGALKFATDQRKLRENEVSFHKSSKYTVRTTQCHGMVEHNACMPRGFPRSNVPTLTASVSKGMWEIYVGGANVESQNVMRSVVSRLAVEAQKQKNARCHGRGVVGVSPRLWSNVGAWNGDLSDGNVWTPCVCDSQFIAGEKCEKYVAGDRLYPGGWVMASHGKQLTGSIWSQNENYELRVEWTGDLAMYQRGVALAIWRSGSAQGDWKSNEVVLKLVAGQGLVVLINGKTAWSRVRNGTAAVDNIDKMVVTNNGELVLYNGDSERWSNRRTVCYHRGNWMFLDETDRWSCDPGCDWYCPPTRRRALLWTTAKSCIQRVCNSS